MTHGVEGEIAGSDRFPGRLRTAVESKRNHKTVLEQFSGIVSADPGDVFGNSGTEARGNLIEKQTFRFGSHVRSNQRRFETQTAPASSGSEAA
jgi:hypothetical protein